MIRHIVTFQYKPEFAASRDSASAQLRGALEPLAHSIPGVQSLEVGIDSSALTGHWDAVLISHHDSAEALAEYQAHPRHLAALEVVATLIVNKSVVDYEL